MRGPSHVRRPFTFALLALALVLAGCSSSSDDGGDDASGPTDGTEEPAATGAEAEEQTFSVLTYNVAGLPQEISQENPEVNIPLISPLLDAYDVVLTQEDFDWWKPGGVVEELEADFRNYHDRLRAATTHEYATPRHPGPEAAGLDPATRPSLEIGDGIGILSRFPLDGFEVRAWEGCFGSLDTSDGGAADCAAMKGFRVATMDLDGVPVDVYSLHAEAGGTEEDQSLQADNFAQLADFIASHSEGRAVILGGDTNLHTDGDHEDSSGPADGEIWAEFLAATGLADACDETECEDPGRIDKIAFRSSDVVTLAVTDYQVPADTFSDESGEALSDHDPVAVTFSWGAPG